MNQKLKVTYKGVGSVRPASTTVDGWRSRLLALHDRVVNLQMRAGGLATRLDLRAAEPGEVASFAQAIGMVSDDLSKLHGEIMRYPPDEAKRLWKSLGGDASILTFAWLDSQDNASLARQVRYALEQQNRRIFDPASGVALKDLEGKLRHG